MLANSAEPTQVSIRSTFAAPRNVGNVFGLVVVFFMPFIVVISGNVSRIIFYFFFSILARGLLAEMKSNLHANFENYFFYFFFLTDAPKSI